MYEFEGRSHFKRECGYRVVFITRVPRRVLYGQLRSHLGDVFLRFPRRKDSRIEKRHLMSDRCHMLIYIPPK